MPAGFVVTLPKLLVFQGSYLPPSTYRGSSWILCFAAGSWSMSIYRFFSFYLWSRFKISVNWRLVRILFLGFCFMFQMIYIHEVGLLCHRCLPLLSNGLEFLLTLLVISVLHSFQALSAHICARFRLERILFFFGHVRSRTWSFRYSLFLLLSIDLYCIYLIFRMYAIVGHGIFAYIAHADQSVKINVEVTNQIVKLSIPNKATSLIGHFSAMNSHFEISDAQLGESTLLRLKERLKIRFDRIFHFGILRVLICLAPLLQFVQNVPKLRWIVFCVILNR